MAGFEGSNPFRPIRKYRLFIGVFSSADDVSQDVKLREELYKSAKSQLNLLKTIGMTQMENEFVKKYKYVTKHISASEEEISVDLEPQEIRKIIHDTLEELSKTGVKHSEL